MRKCFLFIVPATLFLLAVQIDAQNQSQIDFPDVSRVSAYEAYVKCKSGKAIIVQAGGEAYDRRHIMGALSVSMEGFDKGEIKLPNFPKEGIEIFTYCY